MSSPVGACASAGDPLFRWPCRLPGSSFRPFVIPPRLPGSDPPDCPAPAPRLPDSPTPNRPVLFRRLPSVAVPNVDASAPAPRFRLPGRSTPSPRPPVWLPRSPGSSVPAPLRFPREGSSVRIKDLPPPASLPPREPGWPSVSPHRHCWLCGSPTPFLGFRLACADRYGAHTAPRVLAGQEGIFEVTGLSTDLLG